LDFLTPDLSGLERAVSVLRSGGVLAFPTDTVYGLAARAGDERAMRRIYELKGRDSSQPLILMLADSAGVGRWARPSLAARGAMERFWPGPLTLVLPAARGVRPPLAAGKPRSIGVRVPDHALALRLLERVPEGLATTSANRSGAPPALTALEAASLPGVDAVLDGGPVPGGQASTVLDLTRVRGQILRPGPVVATELAAYLSSPPDPI